MFKRQSVSGDAESVLKYALKNLADELYFKKPHFPGHQKFYSREMYERDICTLKRPNAIKIYGATDPVSDMLIKALPSGADQNVLLQHWERAESTINCRTKAFLGLIGPVQVAKLFNLLLPSYAGLPPLHVAGEIFEGEKRIDGEIGQPDLILFGEDVVLLNEMKVRGGKAKSKYNVDQLYKYLKLASILRDRLPKNYKIMHFLLAPLSRSYIIKNHKSWFISEIEHAKQFEINSETAFDNITRHTRQVTLRKNGGATWISRELSRTPCFLLDFSEFTRLASELDYSNNDVDKEATRQLKAIKRFGG